MEPKFSPITFRCPVHLRKQLDDHVAVKDQPRSRFIRAAIVEKLRRDREIKPKSALPQ